MLAQRTLKSVTRAVGLGVHSGRKVELTLKPAAPDSGIVFRRTDLPVPVAIRVSVDAVSDTRMATTIAPGGQPGQPTVQTIEHLLSACAGLGLDNLAIDITGDEVPVVAMAEGVVTQVEPVSGYGGMMVVAHNQGRGGDHMGRLGFVFGGMVLAGSAALLVNMVM